MKKTITITLGIILALPLIFAMMAGTNHTIEFSNSVSECYIYNNQSDLEGLSFVEEGNKVIILTDVRYKPDTFIVSCLVQGQREEEESSGDGGYYTYPWRNKVNAISNETKDINYTEVLEDTEEVTFDDEEVIEESKSIKGRIFGSIAIAIILGFILWKIFRKGKLEEDIV